MQPNKQAPEPFDKSDGSHLDLHSMFHTLQGEGPFSGVPSIFVRLAGCNLQCPFCDTEYTVGRERVRTSDVFERIAALRKQWPNTRLVVLTGGEPTRQQISQLVCGLVTQGLHVQLESNGVLAPNHEVISLVRAGHVAWIVSPKTAHIHEHCMFATAFKYVLSADDLDIDGLPIRALGHKAKPRIARPPLTFRGEVYVNPMDAQDLIANQANLAACRESALHHGYRMGIQLHKLLQLP